MANYFCLSHHTVLGKCPKTWEWVVLLANSSTFLLKGSNYQGKEAVLWVNGLSWWRSSLTVVYSPCVKFGFVEVRSIFGKRPNNPVGANSSVCFGHMNCLLSIPRNLIFKSCTVHEKLWTKIRLCRPCLRVRPFIGVAFLGCLWIGYCDTIKNSISEMKNLAHARWVCFRNAEAGLLLNIFVYSLITGYKKRAY